MKKINNKKAYNLCHCDPDVMSGEAIPNMERYVSFDGSEDDSVCFKQKELIPVVIQDYKCGKVLMLGFMNEEAYEKTITTGFVCFWSRSKSKLWLKGETSGNKLEVKNIFIDCDEDTLLIKVEMIGKSVCHKGTESCFRKVEL